MIFSDFRTPDVIIIQVAINRVAHIIVGDREEGDRPVKYGANHDAIGIDMEQNLGRLDNSHEVQRKLTHGISLLS